MSSTQNIALEEMGPHMDNEVLNLAKSIFGDDSSNSSSSTSTNNKNESEKNAMEEALNNMEVRALGVEADTSILPTTQPSIDLEMFPSNTSFTTPPRPPYLWDISTGQIHTPTCRNEKCHKDVEIYKNEINTLKSELDSKSKANDSMKNTIEVLKKQIRDVIINGALRNKVSKEYQGQAMFYQMLATILAAKANHPKEKLERIFEEVHMRNKGTDLKKDWDIFSRIVSMAERIEKSCVQERERVETKSDPEPDPGECLEKEKRTRDDEVSNPPSTASLNPPEDVSHTVMCDEKNENLSNDIESSESNELKSIEPSSSNDSITGPDAVTKYIKNNQGLRASQEGSSQEQEGILMSGGNNKDNSGNIKGNSNTCTSNSSAVDIDIPLGGDGFGGVTFLGEIETTFDDIDLDEEELFDGTAHRKANKSKSCCRPC